MRQSGSNNHRSRRPAGSRRNGVALRAGSKLPLRFEIRSDFAAGRAVQKRIVDGASRLGYDPQSLFAIRLALEEALINAIKHGNKLDPKKHVTVECKLTPKQAEIV